MLPLEIVTVCCDTGVPQHSVLGPLLFSIFRTLIDGLISTFNISYHQHVDYTSVDSCHGHIDVGYAIDTLNLHWSPSAVRKVVYLDLVNLVDLTCLVRGAMRESRDTPAYHVTPAQLCEESVNARWLRICHLLYNRCIYFVK